MRAHLVVEAQKLRHEGAELRLGHDEDVIEHLPTERPDEALREGVHARCARRAPHDARADALEDAREAWTELPIPIADEHLGSAVHRGVAGLLRATRTS